MIDDRVQWIVQDVLDTVDAGPVGLYEFVWAQCPEFADEPDAVLIDYASRALDRLMAQGNGRLVSMSWATGDAPVELSDYQIVDEDWAGPEVKDPYVAFDLRETAPKTLGPESLKGMPKEEDTTEGCALGKSCAVMIDEATNWLIQEVKDLLPVGPVGLYEFIWLQRGRHLDTPLLEMRQTATRALTRLLDEHDGHLVWLVWPSPEPVGGQPTPQLTKDSWNDPADDPYLAIAR